MPEIRGARVAVVVLLTVLVACQTAPAPTTRPTGAPPPTGGLPTDSATPPSPTPASAPTETPAVIPEADEQEVSAASGGDLQIAIGARVVLPPGSLDTDGHARLATTQASVPSGDDFPYAPVGPAIEISLTRAALTGMAILTLPYNRSALPPDTPEESLVAAYLDETSDQWVLAGGEVDTERGVVTVETGHFSIWAVLSIIKSVLSLSVTDFFHALADLVHECDHSAGPFTITGNAEPPMAEVCLEDATDTTATVRVINRRAFYFDVIAEPGLGRIQLGPGASQTFAVSTADPPPATVETEITQAGWQRTAVELIIALVPGGLQLLKHPAYLATGAQLTEPIRLLIEGAGIADGFAAGDYGGAVEKMVTLVSGESFLATLVDVLKAMGERYGIGKLASINSVVLHKVFFAVAVADLWYSIIEYIAAFLTSAYTESTVAWEPLAAPRAPVPDGGTTWGPNGVGAFYGAPGGIWSFIWPRGSFDAEYYCHIRYTKPCPIYIHWRSRSDNADGFRVFTAPGVAHGWDYSAATCSYSEKQLLVEVGPTSDHARLELPYDRFNLSPSAWSPDIPLPDVDVTCLIVVAYNAAGESRPLQDVLVAPNGA